MRSRRCRRRAASGRRRASRSRRNRPGAPAGDSRRIGGESLAIVSLYLTSTRSSMRAPLRLIEPCSVGVLMRTRGDSRSTTCRLRTAPGASAVGSAVSRAGIGCDLPLTIFVTGGFATGKNLPWISGHANRISAAMTANRTKFWRSLFKVLPRLGSRDGIGSVPAPGMTARDPLRRQPAPFGRAIAAKGGDCIGGTRRLVTAGRRQDRGRAQLPAARDQDEQPCDHRFGFRGPRGRAGALSPRAIFASALSSSAFSAAWSRSMPPSRPIST